MVKTVGHQTVKANIYTRFHQQEMVLCFLYSVPYPVTHNNSSISATNLNPSACIVPYAEQVECNNAENFNVLLQINENEMNELK